jgi:hypothetical protein
VIFGAGILGGGLDSNDPLIGSVKLLLKGEGATITDDMGHVVTAQGATVPVVSSAQAKFGASSIYFAGTLADLSIANAAEFNLGSADFTIDFWYLSNATGYQTLVYKGNDNGSDYSLSLQVNTGSKTLALMINASVRPTPAVRVITGAWNHIAVVRSGNSFQIYLNGVATGTPGSFSGSVNTNTYPLSIGAMPPTTYYNKCTGYLDNFRWTLAARWTANFTPPVASDY